MNLYFQCCLHYDNDCLFSGEFGGKYFITNTKDLNRWIKMGFTLFKLGKALYDKSLGDAFEACRSLYDTYKTKEDQDFVAFISQPFLTSQESDSLVKQLREGDPNFFSLFSYSAQTGNWACQKCAQKEAVKRGKAEAPPPAETTSGDSKSQSVDGKSQSPASSATPPSPRSPLKVNIGMGPLKSMTNVIAMLEGDSVSFYGSEADIGKQKPKHVVPKADIVAFAEVDERVSKKKWNFKLVTLKRNYDCVAHNEQDMAMWKKLLSK